MTPSLPLSGIRVVDLGHTVMGPSAGLILADLGADVIKVEPISGEPTRNLKGFGTGYFGFFNRNKRSLAVDLKTDDGRDIALDLISRSDVLIENFGPGTMKRLRLDPDTLHARNQKLIYASLKGFMPGPYEHRLALDEVVQMMAGLAYMTGPPGRPLRAGSSVVDIAGGMFAVIGILTALLERNRSGRGAVVDSALFESCVFLMGQHLCYAAQNGAAVPPMPARVSAWAVYDLFDLQSGEQLFLGITTDIQWQRFCALSGRADLAADPALATNNQRIAARNRLIPIISDMFAALGRPDAEAFCERASLPFAIVAAPEALFSDRHLAETGGLLPSVLPNGTQVRVPRLPIRISGFDFALRDNPPTVGNATVAILEELGRNEDEIKKLIDNGIIVSAQTTELSSRPRSTANDDKSSSE